MALYSGRIENGEEKKNKNAGGTLQNSINGTEQIKQIQEACMISWVY
ncbi:hypothetical protein T4A_2529 [Trichinella pseudospiralis]|uniref:Uncharacterized protein n=1 Tax=Trichinella pseudospiralis TaxID=6337 RepID=A0A0V1DS25_TRIPS|nr:hypothetical protein T4A_2529 [Trichinella pseudospiralis]